MVYKANHYWRYRTPLFVLLVCAIACLNVGPVDCRTKTKVLKFNDGKRKDLLKKKLGNFKTRKKLIFGSTIPATSKRFIYSSVGSAKG